jgi:hypothetical protein
MPFSKAPDYSGAQDDEQCGTPKPGVDLPHLAVERRFIAIGFLGRGHA